MITQLNGVWNPPSQPNKTINLHAVILLFIKANYNKNGFFLIHKVMKNQQISVQDKIKTNAHLNINTISILNYHVNNIFFLYFKI